MAMKVSSHPLFSVRTKTKPPCRNGSRVWVKPVCADYTEDIVIVGAGIAGLATALSLHRMGIEAKVVEQAETMRTTGTSLTLFKNGWTVLDALGVANQLRAQYLSIDGCPFLKSKIRKTIPNKPLADQQHWRFFYVCVRMQPYRLVVKNKQGHELRSFRFEDVDKSQEVRAVERKVLLQTLADGLPSRSIQYSAKVARIEQDGSGETHLELADGTQLSAKIVIACDGIRSPVARWMGFGEPKYAGHIAFRGLGVYPDRQPFEPRVNYMYGRGIRAGYVPVSPTKVYWFICYNSSSPGPKITNPAELKKQASNMVKNWHSELTSIIELTPDETMSRTPLEDRWLWPGLTPPVFKGGLVLAGDAWHPMTPNLGQGGCCALEDAIILSKKLSEAIKTGQITIQEAFRSYERERWPRIFPLSIRANLVGALLQWDNPVVCNLRDSLVIPKFIQIGPLLEHTNFSCEPW